VRRRRTRYRHPIKAESSSAHSNSASVKIPLMICEVIFREVAGPQAMTKTHALGYFFIASLAVVSAVGIPYGISLTFLAARNSDGPWNFELMLAAALLLWLGVICAVLGLWGFVCVPSRQLARVLKTLVAVAILSPISGYVIGDFCWQREFDGNRRHGLPPFYGPGAVRVGSTVTDGSSGWRSAAESARGTISPYSAGVRYPSEL
jgi:hypothetical protein